MSVLDDELERDAGIPMRWYDVLVHLEDEPDGLRMNELAERILYSKSGFTRVVDRLEEEGLVRRVRPENDRRSILVVLTDAGRKMLDQARTSHRRSIEKHFASHLSDSDVKALARPALRHRVGLRPEAELEGVTPDSVLDSVLATVPVPR